MRIDARSLLFSILFSREFSSRFMLSFRMNPRCYIVFLTSANSASGASRRLRKIARGLFAMMIDSMIVPSFRFWHRLSQTVLSHETHKNLLYWRGQRLDKNCTAVTQMHVRRTGLHFKDRKKAPFLRSLDPAGAFAARGKTCGIARVQVWSADTAVGPTQTSTSVVHHRLKFDKTSSPRSCNSESRGA